MPDWAAAAAPATPSYWTMRGFQAAILDTASLTAAAASALALLAFTAPLGALAAWRYRHTEA